MIIRSAHNVIRTVVLGKKDDAASATDNYGRAFFEVSIHPFVEQIADEDGEPMEGSWSNTCGGEFTDEFGEALDDYPDTMFRKGWSVSSWVGDLHAGNIAVVDEEELPDYEAAIIRAGELAARYGVEIDHRY